MNTTETPRAFSRRISVKSWLISVSVNALVGSSMISSLASSDNALAISTICCWATPSPATGRFGSSGRCSSSSSACVRRRISFQSINCRARLRNGSRLIQTFSAMLNCGTRLNSW